MRRQPLEFRRLRIPGKVLGSIGSLRQGVLTAFDCNSPLVLPHRYDAVLSLQSSSYESAISQGQVSTPGKGHAYRFQANAGQRVTIGLEHQISQGYLTLYGPDGEELGKRNGFPSLISSCEVFGWRKMVRTP